MCSLPSGSPGDLAPVVGVAVDDWTIARLRRHMRDSIRADGEKLDRKVFDRLAARVSYIQGGFRRSRHV
jgi:glucose-6-phosphate 1-dehydrogenase